MLDEILPIILETILEKKSLSSVGEIMESSGCERTEVTIGLNALKDLGLIVKEQQDGKEKIGAISEINGMHLAMAAQVGLDLNLFDRYFEISETEKSIALKLAVKAEQIKGLDVGRRKALLLKRDYLHVRRSDDVYENLMLLMETTNASLYEHIEELAKEDAYLRTLIEMHQQAEKSLRDYANVLNRA